MFTSGAAEFHSNRLAVSTPLPTLRATRASQAPSRNAPSVGAHIQGTAEKMSTKSLYERLGATDGIRKLADDIVAAHMENPVIRARFRPYLGTPDRLATLKKHLVAFLETGSGGPQTYAGRSMPDAHRGMNINEAEYMAAIDDILSVLRGRGIDEPTQKDVLAIAYSLKDQILRV
jgi:hemoglobin